MKVNRYYTENLGSNTEVEYRYIFDQKVCDTCMIVDELEMRLWKHRLKVACFMQSRGCLNTYQQDRRYDVMVGKKKRDSIYNIEWYFGFSALAEWNNRWKRCEESIKRYINKLKRKRKNANG